MVCGKILKDKVKSKLIPKMTGIKPIKEFLGSQRLRWFGDIEGMSKKKLEQ